MTHGRTRGLLLVGLVAGILLFGAGGALLSGNLRHYDLWSNAFYLLGSAAAAFRCARTAGRQPAGPTRAAWWWFTGAAVAYLLGSLAWCWFTVIRGQYAPFPTIADPFYLLVSCLLLGGFLTYRTTPLARGFNVRQLCHLGILLVSALLINTMIFVPPLLARGFSDRQIGVALEYPVLATAVLGVGLLRLWRLPRAARAVLSTLVVGAALDLIARTSYPLQLLWTRTIPTYVLAPFWLGLLAALFLAAWEQDQGSGAEPGGPGGLDDFDVARGVELFIPAFAMLAVLLTAWLLRGQIPSGLLPYLAVEAAILVGLTWGLEWWNRRQLTRLLDQVQAAGEQVRALLDSTAEAIYGTDLTGRITFANPAAVRLLGYASANDLLGREAHALFHHTREDGRPYPLVECPIQRTVHLGDLTEGTEWFWDRAGRGFPVEYRATPLLETGARIGLVVAFTDISARVAAESERAHLEARLRQSQKMEAVGLLAGGIAHDFNNILTAILGTATLLREEFPPDSTHAAEISEIETAALRGANLTRQLLTFGRRQTVQPRVVDLNAIIRQVGHLLHRLLGEEVRLVTDLTPDGAWVLADPGQLEQVLMNLAVNARDAMPRGGLLTLRTTLENPPDTSPGPRVLLVVSDTGVGMPPSVQAHAFEPFFTTKAVGQGTGLGLATVYGIVEQAGGEISLTSAAGVGTTFRIRLPLAAPGRTAAAPGRMAPAPEARTAATRGHETILLVEDEAPVRAIARRILVGAGYDVLDTESAAEARQLAEAHRGRIALLLTDVIMPSARGPELADALRRRAPDLKVIFISGYAADATVERNDVAGQGFIQKPFTVEELLTRVRQVLDGVPAPA